MKFVVLTFFGFLFLMIWGVLFNQLSIIYSSTQAISLLSLDGLEYIALIVGLIIITTTLFISYITIFSNWITILPVFILIILIPVIFINAPLSYTMGIASVFIFLAGQIILRYKLATYINFKANDMLLPIIRILSLLLITLVSITYFFYLSQIDQGFNNHNTLVETVVHYIPALEPVLQPAQKISLTPQQNQLTDLNVYEGSLSQYTDSYQIFNFLIAKNRVSFLIALLLFVIMNTVLTILLEVDSLIISIVFNLLGRAEIMTYTMQMQQVKKIIANRVEDLV